MTVCIILQTWSSSREGCYSLVLGSQMRAKGLGIELGEAMRPWRRKVRFLGLILGLLRDFLGYNLGCMNFYIFRVPYNFDLGFLGL